MSLVQTPPKLLPVPTQPKAFLTRPNPSHRHDARAAIDQPFSWESSPSVNLVSEWAVHLMCDHLRSCGSVSDMTYNVFRWMLNLTLLNQPTSCLWLCMPLMHTDAVRNESALGYSPNSADCSLVLLWHPCWLHDSPPTLLLTAEQQQQGSSCIAHPLYVRLVQPPQCCRSAAVLVFSISLSTYLVCNWADVKSKGFCRPGQGT